MKLIEYLAGLLSTSDRRKIGSLEAPSGALVKNPSWFDVATRLKKHHARRRRRAAMANASRRRNRAA